MTIKVSRSLTRVIAALTSAATLYLLGGYCASQNIWPWPWFRYAKSGLFASSERNKDPQYNPPRLFTFDKFGRLSSKIKSEAVNCPTQDTRTAVLVIAGQSNAANSGGQPTISQHGSRIVNYFDGRCYVAASPLLGSSGINGEFWTEMANLLVKLGSFDKIFLVPTAVGNTSIVRWSAGGDLNLMLRHTVNGLAASGFKVTHVLWHQGETDAAIGMSEEEYRMHFLSFVASLRAADIMAPVYVSVATKCMLAGSYSEGNPIALAQAALPKSQRGLWRGVNSDRMLAEVDRYDGCHFSGSGTSKMALGWATLLSSPPDR